MSLRASPRPLNDVERIHASLSVGEILGHALVDPLGAVAGNGLDGAALFGCEHLEELLEHAPAVPFVRPDDGVGVMVDDDGDVLVAFAVAGFIDADADEPVEASRRIRLQILKGSRDAAADGLPVDQEKLRNG